MDFPVLPEDLTSLTDEQLAELIAQYREAINEAAPHVNSVEGVAALEAAGENLRALEADETRRADEQASIAERVDAVLNSLDGEQTPPEGEGEGEQVPEGGEGQEGAETPPAGDGSEGAGAETPESVTAGGPRHRTRVPAVPRRGDQPDLREATRHRPPGHAPAAQPAGPRVRILAGPDNASVSTGTELDMSALAEVFVERRERLGVGRPETDGETVPIATMEATRVEGRHLSEHDNGTGNTRLVRNLVAALATAEDTRPLTAAGGPCGPVTPYYPQPVNVSASRPVRDGLLSFTIDRGGVILIPPPTLASVSPQVRTVDDGATTNGSATVTSATAAFDARDVGASIAGADIPAGAYIVSVTNATTVQISANATATAAGVTLTITRLGAVGYITAAQERAALNGTEAQRVAATKPCLHVTCGNPVTYELDAIMRCLEFGNLQSRANPEQVEAFLTLAMAAQARRAETALLDGIASNSTAITAALALGAGREVFARCAQVCAGLRSRNRVEPDARVDVWYPAWVIDLIHADMFRGQEEISVLAVAEIEAMFRDIGANVNWYLDSKTGGGQVFGAQAAGAALTFPQSMIWYAFLPGTFVFGDGGTLDFGLVRDSTLNSRNDYRIMVETWEKLMYFTGWESFEVTQTVCASGEMGARRAGGAALVCPV